MISVLLFKIKQWYANALKEYQDSKVSEMQDRVYHGRTYSDMRALHWDEKDEWAKIKQEYVPSFTKEMLKQIKRYKKAKHKKTKGDA